MKIKWAKISKAIQRVPLVNTIYLKQFSTTGMGFCKYNNLESALPGDKMPLITGACWVKEALIRSGSGDPEGWMLPTYTRFPGGSLSCHVWVLICHQCCLDSFSLLFMSHQSSGKGVSWSQGFFQPTVPQVCGQVSSREIDCGTQAGGEPSPNAVSFEGEPSFTISNAICLLPVWFLLGKSSGVLSRSLGSELK